MRGWLAQLGPSTQDTPLTCVTAVTAKPSALVAAITLALCFTAAHTTLAMAVVASGRGSATAVVAVGRQAGGRRGAQLVRSAGCDAGSVAQMALHVRRAVVGGSAGGAQRAG